LVRPSGRKENHGHGANIEISIKNFNASKLVEEMDVAVSIFDGQLSWVGFNPFSTRSMTSSSTEAVEFGSGTNPPPADLAAFAVDNDPNNYKLLAQRGQMLVIFPVI
jgi:hypothetical protein